MDAKMLETDPEIDRALRLLISDNKDSEELQQARERGDEYRRQMRAKYGERNIAVELIREIRDEE
jgi:hypothetical protein